jgi:hypothetical protein
VVKTKVCCSLTALLYFYKDLANDDDEKDDEKDDDDISRVGSRTPLRKKKWNHLRNKQKTKKEISRNVVVVVGKFSLSFTQKNALTLFALCAFISLIITFSLKPRSEKEVACGTLHAH